MDLWAFISLQAAKYGAVGSLLVHQFGEIESHFVNGNIGKVKLNIMKISVFINAVFTVTVRSEIFTVRW